jgi:hypothetical protein
MAESFVRGRGEIMEITHIAPVRRGIVPKELRGKASGPITYADRLKTILDAFQRREDRKFPSVIRLFRGIHVAKWALIDGDTRLLLDVVFDGHFRDYLRSLSHEVPAFLDLIWSNCEGWEPVAKNPDQLISFIEAYQVKVNFLYAHHPQLTVRDIDWLLELRAAVEAEDLPDEVRRKLYQCISVQLEPKSTADRQKALLQEFDQTKPETSRPAPAQQVPRTPLEIAKGGFKKVIGSLYNDEAYRSAYRESFGLDVDENGAAK